MLQKNLLLFTVMSVCIFTGCIIGCERTNRGVAPTSVLATDSTRIVLNDTASSDCVALPQTLPERVSIQDVKSALHAQQNIPFAMLVPQVLEDLGNTYAPESYYIDSMGLHWGHTRSSIASEAAGSCYHPYGFSIVGSFHFVYWFNYRPPSSNAYMAWIPIYAQE